MKTKKEMKKSYKVLFIVSLLVVLAIVGSLVAMKKVPSIESIFIVAVIVILAVIFVVKSVRDAKDEKKGLTIEDERSRKVSLLAGAKSFKITIWYLLILMWISNVLEIVPLSSELSLGAGILGMAIIYGITWLWANKQEDLDQVVKF